MDLLLRWQDRVEQAADFDAAPGDGPDPHLWLATAGRWRQR